MTKKHFVAINNETGERIEFGIEDIACYYNHPFLCIENEKGILEMNTTTIYHWLKNHTLYYLHEGKYYNYETGKEMV